MRRAGGRAPILMGRAPRPGGRDLRALRWAGPGPASGLRTPQPSAAAWTLAQPLTVKTELSTQRARGGVSVGVSRSAQSRGTRHQKLQAPPGAVSQNREPPPRSEEAGRSEPLMQPGTWSSAPVSPGCSDSALRTRRTQRSDGWGSFSADPHPSGYKMAMGVFIINTRAMNHRGAELLKPQNAYASLRDENLFVEKLGSRNETC